MHNFDEMHWMESSVLKLKHKMYSEQQILRISAQLDKSFSKYLFSKAKITRFEKTSFELTVTEILRIKLQYFKIQIPVKKKLRIFYRI